MCNMVYELGGDYGTEWVNQYRCWCAQHGLVYILVQVKKTNSKWH